MSNEKALNTTLPAYKPDSWIADNFEAFQNMKVRDFCMPGSHDAGMSTRGTGTAGAFDCNVVTQKLSILGQLYLGVRYFDIRPVISGGEFYTGHYSEVPVLGWQGANGQSLDSIIQDLNTFTSTHKEIIFLYISHDLDTDAGRDYQPFTQDQYNALMTKLGDINYRAGRPIPDFLDTPLSYLTGPYGYPDQHSFVVMFADPGREGIVLSDAMSVWDKSVLNVYNEYTGTNDLNTMVSDQISKMNSLQPYFLLSWTLTQDATQAATCQLPVVGGASIIDLANTANSALRGKLMPAVTKSVYPKIIYLDAIENTEATDLAVSINYMTLGQ